MNVCIRSNIVMDLGVATESDGPCFDCGHCVAACPCGAISMIGHPDFKPEEYRQESLVKYDDYRVFLERRRSCRWFTGEDVTDKEFAMLFEAARNSPTAENSRDVVFAVVQRRRDEFMSLLAGILEPLESDYPRIRQFREAVGDSFGMRRNPFLWEGRQIIMAFSRIPTDAVIAMTRVELAAYTMGLGGFYSRWIQMADGQDHDRLMSFFPEVPQDMHLQCVFVIGHPRIRFLRTVPRDPVKVFRY